MAKVRGFYPATAPLVLATISLSSAERDSNAPWGDGEPPRGFEMWWGDPSNVLEDMDKFQALYIKFHGCIWSEYGIDNFDDDGENRDGDEEWYQGRTQPFRANAVYSLYGVMNGQFRFRKCTRNTYINTFMTNMGADTILNVLGVQGFDDTYGYGNDYCYEIDEYDASNRADEYDADRRGLSSDNGDENSLSETMGCSLEGDGFSMAVFEGSYCDGNYFLDEADPMEDYNDAMGAVQCEQIWDAKGYYFGQDLLMNSSACEGYAYEGRCADPYGLKQRYSKMLGFRSSNVGMVQKFFRSLSWIALLAGTLLMSAAFIIRRKYGLRNRRRRNRKKRKRRRRSKSLKRTRSDATESSRSRALENTASDVSDESRSVASRSVASRSVASRTEAPRTRITVMDC